MRGSAMELTVGHSARASLPDGVSEAIYLSVGVTPTGDRLRVSAKISRYPAQTASGLGVPLSTPANTRENGEASARLVELLLSYQRRAVLIKKPMARSRRRASGQGR